VIDELCLFLFDVHNLKIDDDWVLAFTSSNKINQRVGRDVDGNQDIEKGGEKFMGMIWGIGRVRACERRRRRRRRRQCGNLRVLMWKSKKKSLCLYFYFYFFSIYDVMKVFLGIFFFLSFPCTNEHEDGTELDDFYEENRLVVAAVKLLVT
jgi:hypothetical protein